eukprot:TRINITY_DN35689_c0_g1_i1.p2 TRINITY_DN35689_c0_g1~~TRINITY_DN35689_c0_g1_i1.p2  ORF type:complete len:236 (-),score=30.45 TRINITY_DN35689_c0_g1_i1:568-1275(-)
MAAATSRFVSLPVPQNLTSVRKYSTIVRRELRASHISQSPSWSDRPSCSSSAGQQSGASQYSVLPASVRARHNGTPFSKSLVRQAMSPASVDTFLSTDADMAADEEFYEVPVHTVTVHDRKEGRVLKFEVPEDQYILQTGEMEGINLPFACRHGCCTACAVRILSGELSQPHALGISPELKSKGYALLCVGAPRSDLEVETQDEDEVYWLQFGRYFAKGPVEYDNYALELAVADE